MLKKIFNSIFGTRNDRLLKEYSSKVSLINALEPEIKKLKDSDFKKKTNEFKNKIKDGVKLDDLIVEVFAHVREASVRSLGMRHFDVQLMGGMALNDGKISEMRTGEGKTLVATLSVYLNALTGKGVHVVTVNDYLARRDAEWMGKLYEFLGLTVGINLSGIPFEEKKIAYQADITYGTNNEFGFDYLRDNMVYSADQRVQRDLNYAVVDEVDSILIDEARTPLIIASKSNFSEIRKYIQSTEVARFLKAKIDFIVSEKEKSLQLTRKGIYKIQNFLNISNLYTIRKSWIPYILNALRAKLFFFKNIHYIKKENKIIIVDEFSGRVMEKRRWNEGIHQAIESKENVPITDINQTLTAITYQNLFLLYPKLSGMTGTAKTAAIELDETYNLKVLIIPTAQPVNRRDLIDFIYIDELSKWKGIITKCLKM